MHKFRASRTLQGRRWLMEQRLEAVEQNDVKRLKQLLSCETPLHPNELVMALRSAILQKSDKSAPCVRILLTKGAPPWGTTGAGTPFLVLASSAGCATIVKMLLEAGCKPNQAAASGGVTALHKAASSGHEGCVIMLLEHGADVNCADGDGNTPLNRSLQMAKPDVAIVLLKQGANPDLADRRGRRPIHWATMEKTNTTGLRMLLQAGCDVNVQDEHGCTPLMYAIYQDNMDATQQLLNRGSDVNMQDCEGNSALLLAADHEGCGCANAAEARERDMEPGEDTTTVSAEETVGSPNNVQSLGEHDCPPEQSEGQSLVAAQQKQATADSDNTQELDSPTDTGQYTTRTKVMAADTDQNTGHYQQQQELESKVSHMANVPFLSGGKSQLVFLLLEAGARPSTRSVQGISPLWRATYYGCNRTVLTLLRYGADPTCGPCPDKAHPTGCDSGRRPLQVAMSHGNLAVVQALYLASLSWGGPMNWLPYHLADRSLQGLVRHSQQVALCHNWLREQWYGERVSVQNGDEDLETPGQVENNEEKDDNVDRVDYSQPWTSHALKVQCRRVIRRALGDIRLPHRIHSLPLPTLLWKYLNLDELDCIDLSRTFRSRY